VHPLLAIHVENETLHEVHNVFAQTTKSLKVQVSNYKKILAQTDYQLLATILQRMDDNQQFDNPSDMINNLTP
jgi:hypothetical protein